jgi:hypothetical protein
VPGGSCAAVSFEGRELRGSQRVTAGVMGVCGWRAAGSTVWCEGGMYPRKLVSDGGQGGKGGKPNVRCACFAEIGWSDLRQVSSGRGGRSRAGSRSGMRLRALPCGEGTSARAGAAAGALARMWEGRGCGAKPGVCVRVYVQIYPGCAADATSCQVKAE